MRMEKAVIEQFLGKFVAFRLSRDDKTLIGILKTVSENVITIDFNGHLQVYALESILYMREGQGQGRRG